MEKLLRSAKELQAEAGTFVRGLSPQAEGATLVTLSGELGAGKTTFTQGLAKALGVEDVVTSPTFVLENIYDLPEDAAFKRLAHIDAYRLERGSDLAPLGFYELMEDRDTLVVLEWPEKVEGGITKPAHALTFEVVSEGRKLIYG
jgi:tRNA threonylcarbamoyladenosine biosynthesis protein TsaE